MDLEYEEDEGDDLILTTMQEKIDMFKKISKEHPSTKK